jgi:hypothetical protein
MSLDRRNDCMIFVVVKILEFRITVLDDVYVAVLNGFHCLIAGHSVPDLRKEP